MRRCLCRRATPADDARSRPGRALSLAVGGLLVALLLAACAPGEAGPTPTPDADAPPEGHYVGPGGVFSLLLPSGWVVGDLSEGQAILLTFAPPGGDRAALTVYAVRLDAPLDEAAFQQAMDTFLAAEEDALTVLDRAAMGDGSWRVTGVRHLGGQPIPVNVFMQRDGPFFSVLEVAVPADDPQALALLTALVNSYRVDPDAAWSVGRVEALAGPSDEFIVAAGNLSFSGVLSWTDETGRFHLTGRVANRAAYAMSGIEVRATLYDDAGGVVAEQVAAPPGSVLLDGEYAPFDVRFDGGRPPSAVRFELRAEARLAADELAAFYGPAAFEWDDAAEYDVEGLLHVRGTVWNVGPATAYHVQAIVTVFDDQDRVAGYVTAPVGEGGPLAAGDSARFDAPIFRLGGPPTRYLVTVWATTEE